MGDVRCAECGAKNKNSNIRCEVCGAELHTENNEIIDKDQINLEVMQHRFDISWLDKNLFKIVNIVFLPFVVAAVWLLVVLLLELSSYSTFSDNIKALGYPGTTGDLITSECNDANEQGACRAVYKYTVGNDVYKASSKKVGRKSEFKDVVTVKYNPDNPKEYVVCPWLWILIVVVMFFVAIALGIFSVIKLCFFNIANSKWSVSKRKTLKEIINKKNNCIID